MKTPTYSDLNAYGRGLKIPALREDFYLEALDLDEAQALIGFRLDLDD